MDEISESIVVGRRVEFDTEIVLFVVPAAGVVLDDELSARIRKAIRERTSPRHVPAQIVAVPAVPRTVTGKLAELAVTDIVNGDAVRNTSGLANPQSLEAISRWAVSSD